LTPPLSIYLDLMRIFAATIVVIFHMNAHVVSGDLHWGTASPGPDGVIIFFVLSGFVISYVAERRAGILEFFVARAARIYSAALLAIFTTIAVDAIGRAVSPETYVEFVSYNAMTSGNDIIAYIFFTNELWARHDVVGSDEPYWSLGFEVWYYAIAGVVFIATGPHRRAVTILMLFIAGPKIAIYFLIWLLGWYAYRIISHAHARGRTVLPMALAVPAFLLAPVLYAILDHNVSQLAPFRGIGTTLFVTKLSIVAYLRDVATGLLFAVHLIAFSSIAPVFAPILLRFGKSIRWIAGATFTLYLTHQPLMLFFSALSPWPEGSVSRVIWVGAGIAGTVLALAELGERRKRLWHTSIWWLLRQPQRQ
jgi:peptidoglycan/LPS O-acetylase OafA/YrhL